MMIGVIKIKLFIDRLIEKIKEKKSHVCVGLDPHLNLLPHFLLNQFASKGEAITFFNKKIIDQVADIAVAVKPQMAFYEVIGAQGIIALQETISYARSKGLFVILDGKKNDIGSTARAYARAYLTATEQPADAMTVNPYLGFDGIEPFIEDPEKGVFILLRTSNKSAGDIQDLKLEDGRPVYQAVGDLINKWGVSLKGITGYSNLGAVVGATYPEELHLLRKQLPDTFFLIPGYGAQGGGAKDIVGGFNDDGTGAIVNSARGIIFAFRQLSEPEEEFARLAGKAALKMRDEINRAIK